MADLGALKLTKYTVVIRWSDEDGAYLVDLPEFAAAVIQPVTHGDTYEQALRHGLEVLEMVIEHYQEESRPLSPLPIQEVAYGIDGQDVIRARCRAGIWREL